ncbi:hypothetical protein PEDI_20420 [Persicobacter diffluens]|uniref:Uncharacterized protein n=1 Tax=Persicobacter diffluens TaxID=981 RepID=A0AAN4W049_9BACT|nr:hypothetical protein PEDI_20420 [Persicobacter diffluens]
MKSQLNWVKIGGSLLLLFFYFFFSWKSSEGVYDFLNVYPNRWYIPFWELKSLNPPNRIDGFWNYIRNNPIGVNYIVINGIITLTSILFVWCLGKRKYVYLYLILLSFFLISGLLAFMISQLLPEMVGIRSFAVNNMNIIRSPYFLLLLAAIFLSEKLGLIKL